jgi:hypothetical protein
MVHYLPTLKKFTRQMPLLGRIQIQAVIILLIQRGCHLEETVNKRLFLNPIANVF